MRSFQKHVISVDLFQVFAKNQYLRIDQAKSQRYVQANWHEYFFSYLIKMSDQLVRLLGFFLWFRNFRWLIIYLDRLLHVFIFEGHEFLAFFDTSHFVDDSLIDWACQLLERSSITKAEQDICLKEDDFRNFLFVAFFYFVQLSRVSDQNSLGCQMINFLHV